MVACSDYRWRTALDTFCRVGLGMATWDALLVPGGVYLVSYPASLPRNYRVGSRMLEFLLEQHRPRRLVLVAHEGCARYRAGLRLPPGHSLAARQQQDVGKVARWAAERYPGLAVEGYYAAGDPASGGTFTPVTALMPAAAAEVTAAPEPRVAPAPAIPEPADQTSLPPAEPPS